MLLESFDCVRNCHIFKDFVPSSSTVQTCKNTSDRKICTTDKWKGQLNHKTATKRNVNMRQSSVH